MTAAIDTARERGFKDDAILGKVKERFPDLAPQIDEAKKRGVDDTSILNYIQQKNLAVSPQERKAAATQKAIDLGFMPGSKSPEFSPIPGKGITSEEGERPIRDLGLLEALQEGFSESTAAIPFGQFPELKELQKRAAGELSFFDTLVKSGGTLAGDLPAMIMGGGFGGVAGGAAGGAAGSVVPGVGTAAGAATGATAGAGAGAFALPTLIRNSYIEYLEAKDKPEGMTFGEFIEATGRVARDTGVSAGIGATVALNPIFGALKKVPGMGKILNTTGKKAAAAFTTEVGTLTGLQAAEEGRYPNAEDLALNTLIIGGFKLSKAGHQKIRTAIKDKLKNPEAVNKLVGRLDKADLQKVEQAKNLKEVEAIIERAAERPEPKVESKAALQEKPAKPKVAEPKVEKRPQTVEEQISELREANPKSFKKDGTLRKNAKKEVRKQFEGLQEEAREAQIKRPAEPKPVEPKTPEEIVSKKEPRVISKQDYLMEKGAALLEEHSLFSPGKRGKTEQRRVEKKLRENLLKNKQVEAEYNRLVEEGKIRPPSSQERLEQAAKGDPNFEQTQAAKRVLEKRAQREAKNRQQRGMDLSNPNYEIKPARYAKGKRLIKVDNETAGKGRTERLIESFGSARWSNREKGYIVSEGVAKKFERAFKEGLDADFAIFKGDSPKREPNESLQKQIKARKGVLFTEEIPQAKGPLDTGALPIEAGKGKAPKRREIIKSFDEAIGPIRQGGVTARKAAAQFDEATGVTRTKRANDIESVSHEMGHKIHSAVWGEKANEALKPYLSELKPLAKYAPYRKEGFAEFTRLYVTNPKKAQEAAPDFYRFFEKTLDKEMKGVRQKLLEARDQYQRWRTADPESRLESQIEFAENKNFFRRSADWLEKKTNIDKWKTNWLDDMFALKRFVADMLGIRPVDVEDWRSPLNVYHAARTLKGTAGRGDVFTEFETFDTNLKTTGKSFKDIMKPLKTNEEWMNMSKYMVAKRALEKSKQGFRTGIEKSDAQAVIKKYNKKYEPIRKEMLEYQDRVLQYFRDSGLISMDTYNKFKTMNKEYVPFYRFFEAGEKAEATGSLQGIQARMPIKGFKGSDRNILDPLESIVRNTYTLIDMADRNRVGQTLAKLAKAKGPKAGRYVEELKQTVKPIAEMQRAELIQKMEALRKKGQLTIDDQAMLKLTKELPEKMGIFRVSNYTPQENVINVWFEGKPKSFRVSPEIYRVFKEGINPKEAGIVESVFQAPASLLRASAILNPRFMQKNMVRDWLGGAIFTKENMNPFYDPFKGLASAFKKDKLYVEWLKAGGGISTMQSLDRGGLGKRLQELRASNLSMKDGLISVKEKAGEWRPIKTMRWLAEITEEANRLAEFRRAWKNDSSRADKELAAFRSRDLSIDFAKIGMKARALNRVIPFWNATIQGTDKLTRAVMQDPARARQAMVRGFEAIVLPSLLLSIANEGDKDIEEMTEEEKDFNFIFKIGDDIYKIPVPFEAGLILNGMTRRFYKFMKEKDPNAFDGFAYNMWEGTAPGLLPQGLKPFIEVWANKDFFRDRAIIPRSAEGLVSELQFKRSTTETAKALSKLTSYMPGVDYLESKFTSPAVIQHFITSWTSSWGRLGLALLDEAAIQSGIVDIPTRPETPITQRLGLDAFKVRFPSANTKSIEKFYDNYFKSQKLKRSVKVLAKEGDIERAEQIQKIDSFPRLDRAFQAMQNMQAEVNLIWKDENMTAKEKKVFIDDRYRRMILFARTVNEQVDAFIKKKEQEAQKK